MALLWRTAVWPYLDDDDDEEKSSPIGPSEYHHYGWKADWKPEHHSGAEPDDLTSAFKVQQEATGHALREARMPVAPEEQKRTVLPFEMHFETGHTLGIENPMKAKFRALVSRSVEEQKMPPIPSGKDGLSFDPDDSVNHSYRLTLFPPSGPASWTVPSGKSKGERRSSDNVSWIDRHPGGPLKHDTEDDDPSHIADHIRRFMRHPETRRFIRDTSAAHVDLDNR